MHSVVIALLLVLNLVISWIDASICGRYWSESKEEGGSFRIYIVCGYIQSIAGFTMVYCYILLLLAPIIMQMRGVDQATILYFEELAANLSYLVIIFPLVSSGFVIWVRTIQITWEKRTVTNIITAGWNTYAQIHNTISLVRNAPSAFEKVKDALIGAKKKSKNSVTMLAIFLVIFAMFAGYFTASSIMKKADREYDAYQVAKKRAEAEAYNRETAD